MIMVILTILMVDARQVLGIFNFLIEGVTYVYFGQKT